MANVKINVEVIQRAAIASLKSLQDQARKTQSAFTKVTTSVGRLGSAFVKLGAAATAVGIAAVTFAIGKFASSSVNTAKQIESLTTRFEVLTGSTKVAKETLEELQEFSARTPFEFEELAEASSKLIAFGFAAEESVKQLEVLGDVAAASGKDVNDLTLIFGQVAAAGKLTGERLLQLRERSIPIGPALAKSLGVAETAVSDLVSKGKVDFQTFQQAFNSLNKEGQAAFGGLEKASRTLEGRLSTLNGNFRLLQNDVGQTLLPAFKAITTAFTTLIQSIRESDVFNQLLVDIGNNIPNAISAAVRGLIFLNEAFQNTRIFINEVSILFDQFIGTIAEVAISVIRSANAVKQFFGQEPNTETLEFLEAFSEVTAESAFETEKANDRIRKSRDELTQFIQQSGQLVVETYNTEKEAAEAEANATVVANDKKKKAIESFFTLRQALVQSQREQEAEEAEAGALLEQERGNAQLERLVTAFGETEAARLTFQANQLIQDKKFEEAKTLLKKKGLEADIAIDKQRQQQESLRLRQRSQFLSTVASLQSSSNSTLFRIGQAAAIAQASLNAGEAISNSYKFGTAIGGPPIGATFAALAGVASAAQIANIASQKPPSFQDGGIVPGNSFSGDNVAAQVNSGEVILNREQQAQTLFAIANGSGGGSGENVTNVTVELDGEVVGRAVSRQVRDGLELGEIA